MDEPVDEMLVIADTFKVLSSDKTFLAFSGHSVAYMSDGSSPYEAEMQSYTISTTATEVYQAGLEKGEIIRDKFGISYKILSFTPEDTGWCKIHVSWQSGDRHKKYVNPLPGII